MAKLDPSDPNYQFNLARLSAAVQLLPHLAGRKLNVLTEEDEAKQEMWCQKALAWVDELWAMTTKTQP